MTTQNAESIARKIERQKLAIERLERVYQKLAYELRGGDEEAQTRISNARADFHLAQGELSDLEAAAVHEKQALASQQVKEDRAARDAAWAKARKLLDKQLVEAKQVDAALAQLAEALTAFEATGASVAETLRPYWPPRQAHTQSPSLLTVWGPLARGLVEAGINKSNHITLNWVAPLGTTVHGNAEDAAEKLRRLLAKEGKH
jgi:DNA repair exonuclease SbcCD ATPase subunit